jgi:hypothetical protein
MIEMVEWFLDEVGNQWKAMLLPFSTGQELIGRRKQLAYRLQLLRRNETQELSIASLPWAQQIFFWCPSHVKINRQRRLERFATEALKMTGRY